MHRTCRLAVTAVTALALTGVPPAQAENVAADAGGPVVGVRLLNPYNPGRDLTTRQLPGLGESTNLLVAETQTARARVTFSYHRNPAAAADAPGWVEIGSARAEDGWAIESWAPGDELLGRRVALRVVAALGGGRTATDLLRPVDIAPEHDPDDPTEQERVVPVDTSAVFRQPYADSGRTGDVVGVVGLTTATGGEVEVSGWDPAAGRFEGRTAASVACTCDKGGQPPYAGLFAGVLPVAPFGEVGDRVAIGVQRDTDGVLVDDLERGLLTSMRANRLDGMPDRVQVTTLDAEGRGLPGVEVRRFSDRRVVGYSDGSGTLLLEQPMGTAARYYANATDTNRYERGVDVVAPRVD